MFPGKYLNAWDRVERLSKEEQDYMKSRCIVTISCLIGLACFGLACSSSSDSTQPEDGNRTLPDAGTSQPETSTPEASDASNTPVPDADNSEAQEADPDDPTANEVDLAENLIPEDVEGGSREETIALAFPGKDKFGTGKSNEYILQLGQQLVAKNFGKHYKVGPSRDWGEADRLNVQDFQAAQGWSGADADGYPGPETWRRLFTPTRVIVEGPESGPTTNSLTQVLYNDTTLRSRMTCPFDGYRTTPGRHEGIDFSHKLGASIHAVTDGVVVNVVEGSKTSLSTIAVYDAASDKTVLYLHSNPSIGNGTTVKRGTAIGTEDARAAGSAVHTHIEVRNGKQLRAARSVGDSVLDNPSPNAYWKSKGYASY